MTFKIIDIKTKKEPDWQKNNFKLLKEVDPSQFLAWHDLEACAIQEDGIIILCDECGHFVYLSQDRFEIKQEVQS